MKTSLLRFLEIFLVLFAGGLILFTALTLASLKNIRIYR